MTELVRPAMYGSHHEIEPVSPRSDIEAERLNIVGGVCESSDILGSDRELAVAPGDLLAIRTAGAYGMSMALHTILVRCLWKCSLTVRSFDRCAGA